MIGFHFVVLSIICNQSLTAVVPPRLMRHWPFQYPVPAAGRLCKRNREMKFSALRFSVLEEIKKICSPWYLCLPGPEPVLPETGIHPPQPLGSFDERETTFTCLSCISLQAPPIDGKLVTAYIDTMDRVIDTGISIPKAV